MKKSLFWTLAVVCVMGCADANDNNIDNPVPVNPQPTVTCGNGSIEIGLGEKCDTPNGAVACAYYDSKKVWESGQAACSADCKSVTIGTCKEVVIQEGGTCGDGSLNQGEKCDGSVGTSCAAYDPTKVWEDGGMAECQPGCQTLSIGTCKEKAPVVQTCESQGKVTCGGTCHDPCADGKTMNADCTCPTDEVSCEDKGKVTCGGTCHEPCADGKTMNADCTCPTDEVSCEDKGKESCGGGCVDPCPANQTRQSDCTCKAEVVADGCKGNDECTDTSKPVCVSGECKASECGDGVLFTPEVCEPGVSSTFSSFTCEQFDDTKQWKEGGKPGCAENCILSVGSCVEEEEIVSDKCGDGKVDKTKGEECDPGKADSYNDKTCNELVNANERYTAASKVGCNPTTCKFDTSNCIVDVCGNGEVDALNNEKCDFGMKNNAVETEMKCINLNAKNAGISDNKWNDGTAKCTNTCGKLDTTACKTLEDTGETGVYWCQLMAPTNVTFDATTDKKTMTVRYKIAGDVTESKMKAQLVYGSDYTKISGWKTIDATQDASNDKFTADLTKAAVEAAMSKDGKDVEYYTFRISPTGNDADYVYCKMNQADEATEVYTLDPVPLENAETTEAKLNSNTLGSAMVSSTQAGSVLASFNFDDNAKYKGGDPTNGGNGWAADEGTGTIMVGTSSNWKCPSSQCFSGGVSGQSFQVGSCKSSKSDALSEGNSILISGVNANGASGINLSLYIKRNSTDSSPKNVIVLYSTDGEHFTEVKDIALNEKDKNFYEYKDIELPSGANNTASLSVKLLPYGVGSGSVKFDNIVLSQKNE